MCGWHKRQLTLTLTLTLPNHVAVTARLHSRHLNLPNPKVHTEKLCFVVLQTFSVPAATRQLGLQSRGGIKITGRFYAPICSDLTPNLVSAHSGWQKKAKTAKRLEISGTEWSKRPLRSSRIVKSLHICRRSEP